MFEFQPLIYKNLEFGVDLESRIALVGPNGAGKSTLLKLIDGEVCILNYFIVYTLGRILLVALNL